MEGAYVDLPKPAILKPMELWTGKQVGGSGGGGGGGGVVVVWWFSVSFDDPIFFNIHRFCL